LNELLTAAQAAERLGVDSSTVARWCRKGLLPASKPGGHDWLISPDALEGFTHPARGPKPGADRRRLSQQAAELVEVSPGLLNGSQDFETGACILARATGNTKERARQALAKAIRRARNVNHK